MQDFSRSKASVLRRGRWVRLRWYHGIWPRLTWWSRRRYRVVAVDVDSGAITMAARRWSWREWDWVFVPEIEDK